MKIKFVPTGQEIDSDPSLSLLQLATKAGIEIRSLCKGVPSCAECRVKIIDGESNIIPPTDKELHVLGTNYHLDGRRLSCQVYCFGNVTVDITEQVERSEHQNKKVRGYRSQKKGESKPSHAKQGIMMLEDAERATSAQVGSPSSPQTRKPK